MEPIKDELDYLRWLEAATYLLPSGFKVAFGFRRWIFTKNNINYDLSAADVTQYKLIEENGLFVIPK